MRARMRSNTQELRAINQNLSDINELEEIEELKHILDLVYNQQDKADNKASFFMTLCLAILGYTITQINETSIALVGLLILIIGAICCFYSVHVPTFSSPKNLPLNLYYFDSIASMSHQQFKQYIKEHNTKYELRDKLRADLITQIHINSRIIKRKYARIKIGVFLLMIVFIIIFVWISVAGIKLIT